VSEIYSVGTTRLPPPGSPSTRQRDEKNSIVCGRTAQPFDSARTISLRHDSPREFRQGHRPLCPKPYSPAAVGVPARECPESRFVSHRLGPCGHMSAFPARSPEERTGNRPQFERYCGQSRAPRAL
jgi:hypothetical protein